MNSINSYGAHAALLERSYGPLDPEDWADGRLVEAVMTQAVDGGGRVVRSGEVQKRIAYSGDPPTPNPAFSRQTAMRSYYGVDGRLAAVQRYAWLPSSTSDGSWEEYFYDALGRRIRTDVRRDDESLCTGSAWCESHTATALWDGDALVRENRSPTHGTSFDAKLHGTRSYVPGLALDQPLGLCDGRVFNPSWRGVFESSVWADGTAGDASVGIGTGTVVDWPAAKGVYWTPGPGGGDAMPPAYAWLGDLAIDGAQSTGQLYRRNRFYDPASGQFTQADPIGLAGGSSLFGFAGGDPINFSDPFGLCPISVDGIPCTLVLGGIGAAGGAAIGGIAGAGGGTLVAPVVGTVTGAAAGAMGGAVAGGALGATAGLLMDLADARLGIADERRVILIGALVVGGLVGKLRETATVVRDVVRTEQEAQRRKREEEKRRRDKEKEGGRGDGDPPDDPLE